MAATTSTIPKPDHTPNPDASYLDETHSLLHGNKFVEWATTLDHKRIGVMYLVSVMIAFLIGGIFALLVRLELFSVGKTIMDGDTYNRMFTLHGVVMVFLFIIPSIAAAMGNIILFSSS